MRLVLPNYRHLDPSCRQPFSYARVQQQHTPEGLLCLALSTFLLQDLPLFKQSFDMLRIELQYPLKQFQRFREILDAQPAQAKPEGGVNILWVQLESAVEGFFSANEISLAQVQLAKPTVDLWVTAVHTKRLC